MVCTTYIGYIGEGESRAVTIIIIIIVQYGVNLCRLAAWTSSESICSLLPPRTTIQRFSSRFGRYSNDYKYTYTARKSGRFKHPFYFVHWGKGSGVHHCKNSYYNVRGRHAAYARTRAHAVVIFNLPPISFVRFPRFYPGWPPLP